MGQEGDMEPCLCEFILYVLLNLKFEYKIFQKKKRKKKAEVALMPINTPGDHVCDVRHIMVTAAAAAL